MPCGVVASDGLISNFAMLGQYGFSHGEENDVGLCEILNIPMSAPAWMQCVHISNTKPA